MSIHSDIQKVTKIPETNETSLFIPRKETGQNKRTKRYKTPENAKLYNSDEDNNNQEYNNLHQGYLCEDEIRNSIREANDGVNYSNKSFELLWKARQIASRNSNSKILEKDSSSSKSCYSNNSVKEIHNSDEKLSDSNKEKDCIEDEENILKICKLNKNAVIRGLLKNHIISTKDLCVPNNCTEENHESNICEQQDENDLPLSNLNEKYSMKLVECPEVSEVFVQPLQAYGSIDENEHKDIDFTVPHVGKKNIVTARQFFINMDDSNFDFVKKNRKTN